LRALEVKPDEAKQHIVPISKKLLRLNRFTITNEGDLFSPIRIKKKVRPMMLLRKFNYDHEFCKDFMRSARYATFFKIRKTSLDFNLLKRMKKLTHFYLNLKSKYLTLPFEDTNYINELAKTLLELPELTTVTIEQEIDPDVHSHLFYELNRMLKDKVKINFIADLVDVSNQRNRDNSAEKTLQNISESGVSHLKLNYVGVTKAIKRFEKSFYAPIHMKKEIYDRFLRTLNSASFKNITFEPTVHSSYVDDELKDALLDTIRPSDKFNTPNLTIIYQLDLIEAGVFDTLLHMYNYAVPSYDIAIISTSNIRKSVFEVLKGHYLQVLSKLQKYQVKFSLEIAVKDLSSFAQLLKILAPNYNLPLLRKLCVNIIDPLTEEESLSEFSEVLHHSYLSQGIEKLQISVSERALPSVEDLFKSIVSIYNAAPKVHHFILSYHNSRECKTLVKRVFEKLRYQYPWVDFEYEINRERPSFE